MFYVNRIKDFSFGDVLINKPKTFGIVKMQAVKDGSVIREREFHNLITNNGMDYLATTSTWYTACRVGTGTAIPAFTDTSLAAQVAVVSSTSGFSTANAASRSEPSTITVTHTFPVGAINANLTEIGYSSGAGGNLSVRALITDSGGLPTSFPVSSDEQLRTIYVRGMYAPAEDIETTQTLSSTTFDVTIRCIANNASSNPFSMGTAAELAKLSTQTSLPGFGGTVNRNADSTARGADAYVNGSFERGFFGTWGAGAGVGTFPVVGFDLNGFRFAMLYSSPIVKTSAMALHIPFKVTWDRR